MIRHSTMIRAFVIAFALTATAAFGQIPLDQRSIPTPSKDFVRAVVEPDSVGIARGGNGVVWDYSRLRQIGTAQQRYLAPFQFPPAVRAAFPTAQVGVQEDTVLSLYETVGRYLRKLGTVTPNTQVTVSTDPYDTRPTEIVYSGQLLDAHRAQLRVGPSFTGQRSGQDVVVYDGFGRLLLPNGSYNNVARLNRGWITVDTISSGTDVFVVRQNGRRVTYQQVTGDTILLEYTTFTTRVFRNGAPTGQPVTRSWAGYYLSSGTTSVERESAASWQIGPNPLRGTRLTVRSASGIPNRMEMFDLEGARVDGLTWQANGDEAYEVIVPVLASGTYMLVITDGSGGAIVRMVTVAR